MKISGKRKILIFCLTLLLAFVTVLFATQFMTRKSYAQVSPDGLSAYDNESENEADDEDEDPTPGPGQIAPPQSPDDDDFDWVTAAQQVTLEIDKLVIRVIGWNEAGINTKAKFNPNPDGIYDSRPDLVDTINSLLSSDFITYEYRDVHGNIISKDAVYSLGEGVTIFIHIKVDADYEDFVTIQYADGVSHSYSYTTDFLPSNQGNLTPVPQISPLEYTFDFDGTAINVETKVINEILKNKDAYLMFVASESDPVVLTAAGEYFYTISFVDGALYYWANTSYSRASVVIKVTVKPLVLEVTSDLGDKYYTGYDIDVLDELKALYGDHVVVAPGYSSKGKDVGEYSFHITINPAYNGSIQWKEGTQWAKDDNGNPIPGHVEITWRILKSTVTPGDWDEFGRLTVTSDTGYEMQAGDIEYKYYDKDGNPVDPSDLVVGEEYDVEAELTNPNLEWTSEPGRHTFKLEKELIIIPLPKIDKIEVEYNGTAITFVITIDGKVYTESEFYAYIEVVTSKSDALIQTNAGTYYFVFKLKDDSMSWEGNLTGEYKIEFKITQAKITISYDPGNGTPTFTSGLVSGDYSVVGSYHYEDLGGNRVSWEDMVLGRTYVTVIDILDYDNFEWPANTTYQFTYTKEFKKLEVPVVSGVEYEFTGDTILLTVENQTLLEEYLLNGYIELVPGYSFEVTTAGEHIVKLVIVNNEYKWAGTEGSIVELKFTVKKAVLTGSVGSNGVVHLDKNSFTGNYDDVLEYVYYDDDGNIVDYKDLVKGQHYTVKIQFKGNNAMNFDDSLISDGWGFTFSGFGKSGKAFPWWIFIIVGIVLLLIIIFIIVIVRRRNKDDDYDDYYDDEYYGDEEGDGTGEGDGEGDYGDDDYGDGYDNPDYGDGSGDGLGDDYGDDADYGYGGTY